MRKLTLLVAFILTTALYSQSFSNPESVEWDAANNRWLISNTTTHTILARSQSGVLTTLVPNGVILSGPHGLEIFGNVVYACCGSLIRGFDLTTGSPVFSISITGASFLNGLTTDDDSVLYATDFSALDIIRINPSTNKFYKICTATVTTPNGIIYDGANSRCVFVNWGNNAPIKAIGVNPPYTVTTIATTTLDNCDGITRDQLGYYYVSDWGSDRLSRFANDFSGGFTSMTSFPLYNPADIDCKFGTIDTIGVPNTNPDNTCSFIPLAPPTPSYTMNDSTVCLGDQITFTNTSSNADSFSWIFDGGNPGTGSTSPANVDYDTLGTYSVVLTTTNIYGTTSVTHQVTVSPLPTPAIVAVVNDLSTTTTFPGYQWYRNGILIPGATSQNYTVTSGGAYYCIVTDVNGCNGTSNTINSTLAIEDNFAVNTKVFPNPAAEMLTVELMLPEAQSINYAIIDMQGRILRSSTEVFEYQGLNYIIIDLDGITNGTYVLKLNAENMVLNRSFVVSK